MVPNPLSRVAPTIEQPPQIMPSNSEQLLHPRRLKKSVPRLRWPDSARYNGACLLDLQKHTATTIALINESCFSRFGCNFPTNHPSRAIVRLWVCSVGIRCNPHVPSPVSYTKKTNLRPLVYETLKWPTRARISMLCQSSERKVVFSNH